MLLHDALLNNALLHLDVLVYGELVDRMQRVSGRGRGAGGIGRGEPLSLHLRVLQSLVQPLHREGVGAEVIHGGGWACRPSRATPASTDDTRASTPSSPHKKTRYATPVALDTRR